MISWFTKNGVAANLLMGILVLGGLLTMRTIKLELFPEFSLDMITVSVPYPRSSPEEVEEAICVRVEEKIFDLPGIKQLKSIAREGLGVVMAEVERGTEPRQLLDDIKIRVDSIDTFPVNAEKPIIEEKLIKKEVVSVAIVGDTDEKSLKRLAEKVRDEMLMLPGITQITLGGIRDYEISIEVSENALRKHGLTFDYIAERIRASSIDMPGGSLKTNSGEFLLRVKGQAYIGDDFEKLVLITRDDGSRITLGDIATVADEFEDNDMQTTFNEMPAAILRIFEVGNQNTISISKEIKKYIAQAKYKMPKGVELVVWRDMSFYLKARIRMLLNNGAIGLLLVLSVLALFLRPSIAFWVALGIPISFLGTFLVMPWLGVSINLLSLFGFILVLGIVVDDAIVVGESAYTHFLRDGPGVQSSINGANAVAMPVTFAVLTTAVAFVPLLLLPGFDGKFLKDVPLVVIPTLMLSLVESKLVLPYHLSLCNVSKTETLKKNISGFIVRIQRKIASSLEWCVEFLYAPVLKQSLRYRYTTIACFIGLFAITVGMVKGGLIKFTFSPPIPSDYIVVSLEMPNGAPIKKTKDTIKKIDDALKATIASVKAEGMRNPILHTSITSGGQLYTFGGGPAGAGETLTGSHLGEFLIEMVKSEERDLSAIEFSKRWRNAVGALPEARNIMYSATAGSSERTPIEIQLVGNDLKQLQDGTEAVKNWLAQRPGIFDIHDTYSGGKKELKLKIKPSAEALGLTQANLAKQVRQAYYGEEVQRIQRGRDDIKVMVRYTKDERGSLASLENMRIRTPNGTEVPFYEVAEAQLGWSYPTINRVDRKRSINVIADADKEAIDLHAIKQSLQDEFLPGIRKKFPDIQTSLEGESRNEAESNVSMLRSSLLVLIIMYALMAIPFKSYLQPLLVMSVIPFGFIGAAWGHLIFMKPLSQFSTFGFIALAGVVVNDSLVLVDFMNRHRNKNKSMLEAVKHAGSARFRPILLTSLTTFVGLLPILMEKSLQAQFLIPMAISLAFGVMFATFITLLLLPSLYLVLEDIKRIFHR